MIGDAVLLMAYGAPERLDDVEPYYTHIRGGTPPPRELLADLLERYRAIGGGSPLARIVERQRAALAVELARRGRPIRVAAGMKHSTPFIAYVVRGLAADGARRIAAIALAPQHSRFNDQTYGQVVRDAAATAPGAPEVTVVGSWHDHPLLIAALAAATGEALERCTEPRAASVVFTAHSLPERVAGAGDPYAREVAQTAALVAERLGTASSSVAFQSAGRTADRWIGPSLASEIRRVAATGAREVVVCAVGFVADHLEVLFDVDVEARGLAGSLGLHLERARSLNDDPTFIAALADVAEAALAEAVAA